MDFLGLMRDCKDIVASGMDNIVFIVFFMLMTSVYCVRALYTTSIEEIFMSAKNKLINNTFKLLFIGVVLIPKNLFLAVDIIYIIIGLIMCVAIYVFFLVYKRKEAKIENDSECGIKLKIYYKDKQSQMILSLVMYGMPIITILFREMRPDISLIMCAVITSVVEVAIIGISMPELILKKSMDYYVDGTDRIFLYKSLKNNNFLCGDNESISLASKYLIISYEDLCTKEILHQQYKGVTKAEKKELCKKLKSGE